MARTTYTEVKKVINTALEDGEINDLIDFANRMVTTILNSSGLTSAQLKDIETYLTAHLIAISMERQTVEEKVGDVWVKYHDNPDGWLNLSNYGMTIIAMDTSGLFERQSKKKATFQAINQVART